MANRESIKFVSAALDEDGNGNIVLRGVIEPASLYLLKVGAYQREILPITKIKDLEEVFSTGGRIPDIDLGMRGGNFLEKESAFFLQDDTYIIDGLQRVTAAKKTIESGKVPRLGGIVHFNTTEEWERNRFRILNTMNTKLSPNVLLRNMQTEYNAIELLYTISKDKSFVLGGKVCWQQRMKRDELITALTMLRVAGIIHAIYGPSRGGNFKIAAAQLEKIYNKIGRNNLRENIKTFWSMMDQSFKLSFVTYKERQTFLKSAFILTLAGVIGDHANYWKDAKLFISKEQIRQIAQFPINDPQIVSLASYSIGGSSGDLLYQILLKHLNKGKTKNRLISHRKSLRQSKKEQTQELSEE